MKKKIISALCFLCVIALLVGCAIQQSDASSASSSAEQSLTPNTGDTASPLEPSTAPEPTPSVEAEQQPSAPVTPKQEQTPEPIQQPMPSADSSFEVHFIDVGQGDCSLILCDDAAMLIDGGEASESSKVYAYLKAHEVDHLDYIVATHAHSDHIGGLSGALNYATVDTALCPVTDYDSKTFDSFVKYLGQQNVSITVPSAGDEFSLGSASVEVLGPQHSYDDPNDTSIVLKITYGNTSFLFTGDAERTAEADILEAGYDLSATVLKVGHHGSDTSTSYPFLREVMPEYGVICVGKDNSYGHPTDDTLSRLRDADVKVYRTDLQGTIICTSDGEKVAFTTERNESAQTNPTVSAPAESTDIGEYIGNRNSKVFHLPTCKNLPAGKNQVYFDSRQEAVDAGFRPCGNCDP
jgi:competence protein ComEC